MDLKEALLAEHSKKNTLFIASWIGTDLEKYQSLIQILCSKDYILAQRAAWVFRIVSDSHPNLLKPHLQACVENLGRTDIHDSVKRNTLAVLMHVNIPEEMRGSVANFCFACIESHEEPIGIQVFAMDVLANICKKHPELLSELKLVLQGKIDHASSGFKARALRIFNNGNRR